MPPNVHTTTFGLDSIRYYLEDWEKLCDGSNTHPLKPHLHHFVLVVGLLLRDIEEAYFNLEDPDDTVTLPNHIASTQLGLDFAVCIENVVKTVWQSMAPRKPPKPQSSTRSGQPKSPLPSTSRSGGNEPILPPTPTTKSHKHRKDTITRTPQSVGDKDPLPSKPVFGCPGCLGGRSGLVWRTAAEIDWTVNYQMNFYN